MTTSELLTRLNEAGKGVHIRDCALDPHRVDDVRLDRVQVLAHRVVPVEEGVEELLAASVLHHGGQVLTLVDDPVQVRVALLGLVHEGEVPRALLGELDVGGGGLGPGGGGDDSGREEGAEAELGGEHAQVVDVSPD